MKEITYWGSLWFVCSFFDVIKSYFKRQFCWTGHGVEWEKQGITTNSFGEEALKINLDSSISLVTRLLDNQEFRIWVPAGARDYSLHHQIHAISRTCPSTYSVGTRFLTLCVKRLESEANNTPASGAKIGMLWAVLPLTLTSSWYGA
jgi:hypothetical protein